MLRNTRWPLTTFDLEADAPRYLDPLVHIVHLGEHEAPAYPASGEYWVGEPYLVQPVVDAKVAERNDYVIQVELAQ